MTEDLTAPKIGLMFKQARERLHGHLQASQLLIEWAENNLHNEDPEFILGMLKGIRYSLDTAVQSALYLLLPRTHVDMARLDNLAMRIVALNQTLLELQRRAKLRDRYKNQELCLSCHNGRYNIQSNGDDQNAPTTGEGCWHLNCIKKKTSKGQVSYTCRNGASHTEEKAMNEFIARWLRKLRGKEKATCETCIFWESTATHFGDDIIKVNDDRFHQCHGASYRLIMGTAIQITNHDSGKRYIGTLHNAGCCMHETAIFHNATPPAIRWP